MTKIEITSEGPKDTLRQIQNTIGGQISEKWNEYSLIVNNEHAFGSIKFIPFDWGVNMLSFDIKFSEDLILIIKAGDFNPIRFIYNYQGYFKHRFGINNEEKRIDQFHSLIFTNKTGGYNLSLIHI